MISVEAQRHLRRAAGRAGTAFAFGAAIATPATWIGTRDLESYEHVFFSLDRGTAVRAIEVLGHPVYTLAIGLGVRLPLQGNLGGSPAALVAPYLPPPVTYWLLLAITIALVVLIIRRALAPLGRPWIAWAAAAAIFCSVPMVAYTFYGDWPEVVVTYCAFVGGVFAPHALLALGEGVASRAQRRLAAISIVGSVGALVAVSHPGYWPLVALSLVASAVVTLCRSDYPVATRIKVIAILAAAACIAVAPQVPDIMRELTIVDTDGMRRTLHGPGRRFFTVNLFPFRDLERADPEMPFGLSALAIVALVVGATLARGPSRRMIIASAVTSLALAAASATMSPGSSLLSPSSIWAIRDPATIFAVMAAAYAAATLLASDIRARKRRAAGLVALLVGGLQGPAYATSLVHRDFPDLEEHRAWTRNAWPPRERATRRGLTRQGVQPGHRLVLWPGVRDSMRNQRLSSTDFADAGYLLVNAWTKHRTMRGVVEPNDILFNQVVELPAEVLCDLAAVQFLQLRYLLRPSDVAPCAPWRPTGGAEVDEWLAVDMNESADTRVHAVDADQAGAFAEQAALSAGSALLPLLAPLDGTSLTMTATSLAVRVDAPVADGRLIVLPVAYDEGWRSSAGEVRNVGGLLALSGADERGVTMRFVPDSPAILRAAAMTVAQVLTLTGFVFLAVVDDRRTASRGV